MISLVRVDDRLVHGQVTVGWAPYLQASRIVVVSDRLAGNAVLAAILKSGSPVDVRIDVVCVGEAAGILRRGAASPSRMVVLFESLADVRHALETGMALEILNIGGLRGRGQGIRVSDAVFLSAGDQGVLRELSLKGVVIEVRIMPTDRPRYLFQEEDGQWRI